MVHVPYKGGPPGVNDVLGGRVGVMLAPRRRLLPHIRSGKLRGIATTGARRSVYAPEIPTIAESGFADFDVVIWNALFAPRRPLARCSRSCTGRSIEFWLKRHEGNALEAGRGGATMTDAALRELLRTEYERWGRVIREAKIKVD